MKRIVVTERTYLIAAVVAGFLLRSYSLLRATSIEMDGIAYATMADQFCQGLFGQALNNVFPPIYPAVIALVHLIVSDVELAGRLVSLVAGVALIFLCFSFSRRLLKSDTKAVWVAFLLALHPYLIRYSGQVLSESLATFLFTLTVFAFYIGWQEQKRYAIGLAGFCLVLTYLTRPEYVVFYAPFVLLLALKKRIGDIVLLLLPFFLLGVSYILYLRLETGFWIISKKATLSPFVPYSVFLRNVPLVVYEFFIAVFPLFFLFATLGFSKVNKSYRNLVVILAAFHILSLSLVSHATKRYSVEFIPVVMIFAVEGIGLINEYLKKFLPGPTIYYAMAAVITIAGVFQAFTPVHQDRVLYKEAGLFLLKEDPGSIIAARLPLVAFYGKGKSIDLFNTIPEKGDPSQVDRILSERKVKYLIVDEKTVQELPGLRAYAESLHVFKEFRRSGSFVYIYRLFHG